MRWKRIVVGLAAIGGAALITQTVSVWPKIAPPPEHPDVVERNWTDVEGWAALRPEAAAPVGEILEALDRAGNLDSDIRTTFTDSPVRRLPAEAVPTEAVAALDPLIRWASRGGGFGPELCSETSVQGFPVMAALTLSALALGSAEHMPDTRVGATLHLAWMLRNSGSLIAYMTGLAIADESRTWADARGFQADTNFHQYRPDVGEVFPMLAREGVCGANLLATSNAEIAKTAAGLGMWKRLWSVSAYQRWVFKQGTLHYKWWTHAQLARAREVSNDLQAMDRIYNLEADDLPENAFVQLMHIGLGGRLQSVEEQIRSYDAFVAR